MKILRSEDNDYMISYFLVLRDSHANTQHDTNGENCISVMYGEHNTNIEICVKHWFIKLIMLIRTIIINTSLIYNLIIKKQNIVSRSN